MRMRGGDPCGRPREGWGLLASPQNVSGRERGPLWPPGPGPLSFAPRQGTLARGAIEIPGLRLTSARVQSQVIPRWIGEDGEPANTGNFGLGQNSFTTMSFHL